MSLYKKLCVISGKPRVVSLITFGWEGVEGKEMKRERVFINYSFDRFFRRNEKIPIIIILDRFLE